MSLESLPVKECTGIILSDKSIGTLLHHPTLLRLDVASTKLTGADAEAMILDEARALRAPLQELDVSSCFQNSRDVCWWLLLAGLGDLRVLNLEGCEHVTDEILGFIAHACPRLRSVTVGALPHAEYGETTSITDEGILALAANGHLEKLVICWCRRVTDESLKGIAERSKGIQELDLRRCSLRDEGMKALASCRKLCRLMIEGPNSVSDEGIRSLRPLMPTMQVLSLMSMNWTSQEVVSEMQQEFPLAQVELDNGAFSDDDDFDEDDFNVVFSDDREDGCGWEVGGDFGYGGDSD